MNGVLVFSPHPDDAVFSLGPWLAGEARRGVPVTIATVFSASDVPAPDGRTWAAAFSTGPVRHNEDRQASAYLGAEAMALGCVDAVSRHDMQGLPLYATLAALRQAPAPTDHAGATQVNAAIEQALRDHPHRRWCFPLGIGEHVDHVLTAAFVGGHPSVWQNTMLYEDIPYVLIDPTSTRCRRQAAAAAGWQVRYLWSETRDVEVAVAAMQAYRSQVSALFRSPQVLTSMVKAYLRRCAAEVGKPGGWALRCWQRAVGRAAGAP